MKLRNNAIFKLEMTTASKKKSTVVLIIVFVMYVFFATFISFVSNGYLFYGSDEVQNILFIVVAASQLAVNLVICPLFTAVKISQERERQTFDMLIATGMTPFEIVMGKYVSSVLRILLFSVALLPVYAYMMLLGGISPLSILILYLMVIFEVLALCAFSIMFSALSKRSVGAVFLTFGVLAGYEFLNLILILIHYIAVLLIFEERGLVVPGFLSIPFALYFNPVVGAFFLLGTSIYGFDYGGLIFSFTEGTMILTMVLSFAVIAVLAVLALIIAVKVVDPFKKEKNKSRKVKNNG